MATSTTITLETPLMRGAQEIAEIELRKPKAGDLRGLSLSGILQMEYSAVAKLLPRISSPALTEADITKMEAADFLQFASATATFFLTRKQLQEAEAEIENSDSPTE